MSAGARNMFAWAVVIAMLGTGVSMAGVPMAITHQGVVSVAGERFTGTGEFYFSLVDTVSGTNLWTNDESQIGSTERPDTAVSIQVVNGGFSVSLGASPMPPIPSTVFENVDVLLRAWFDDGRGNGVHQLTPDQKLTSAPYVYRALDADHATEADHSLEADHAADATTLGGFLPRELMPAGAMMAYGGATAPNGWLMCDGSVVNRATHADLFAAIGTAYGAGDGSTTFHLPDMRGRFARGVSGGSGGDPNAAQRTASNSGGNTGNAVGSLQQIATARPTTAFTSNTTGNHSHSSGSAGAHSHSTSSGGTHQHFGGMRADGGSTFSTEPENGTGASLGLLAIPEGGSHTHTTNTVISHTHSIGTTGNHSHSITGGGDSETRPVNVYVNWIIKR